ncbi:DUF2254 domain-containing protein [Robertkochia flava]|uniref:DUF2254 domain-containing protein n=1 Tax=Robertkochia flava TaxID=3447986 RepID=UPI001CCE8F74|nr:DUF2254 domain-containing protein [Robertkochia marina]
MKLLYNKLVHFLNNLESKIAFYPTLISLLGFLLTFIVLYLEQFGISAYLEKAVPILIIEDAQTARTILSTFISGLISLMVFSFSMVMILLNQASNNFSPRLLPGLISNRKHQLVLGTFLASLIYCIFMLISIETSGTKDRTPGFPILVAIILTIICLGVFVYFIHSISQSIQVNTILDTIHKTSKKRLNELISESEKHAEFPDTAQWHEYHANKTGYYQDIMSESLLTIAEKQETRLEIIVPKGSFVLKGIPLLRSENPLEEESLKTIRNSILYSKNELLEDNYVLAFKQITEIAVKAMSPGINDPGTALNAIDYLTELFAIRMKKEDQNFLFKDDQPQIKLTTVSFSNLLYNVMASLRLYCKHDVSIMQKLFLMLKYLLFQTQAEEHYKDCIRSEAKTLLEDAESSIENPKDLEVIKNLANTFLT